MEGHIHGGIYTRGGHTHGGDIHMEGHIYGVDIHMKGHTHGGTQARTDIYTKETYIWRDIHI